MAPERKHALPRKTLRTYKRARPTPQTTLSSPPQPRSSRPFSSPLSSPLSSPPLRTKTATSVLASSCNVSTAASHPPEPAPQPAFSVSLSRRTTLRSKPTTTKTKKKLLTPSTPLTQLTIDLGQTIRTTCHSCGMSYAPSNPTDSTLHTQFHTKHLGGIEFSGPVEKPLWVSLSTPHEFVTVVDWRSSAGERRKAKEAMGVVECELGAAEIGEKRLWGKEGEGRWRVYLFVQQVSGHGRRGYKVVGVLLAERIEIGHEVREDGSLEEVGRKALMGVARVWTCVEARRRGVARMLVECARKSFVYGMEIPKEMVAFSQPTDSGGRLARAVLGDEENGRSGWMVYKEKV